MFNKNYSMIGVDLTYISVLLDVIPRWLCTAMLVCPVCFKALKISAQVLGFGLIFLSLAFVHGELM